VVGLSRVKLLLVKTCIEDLIAFRLVRLIRADVFLGEIGAVATAGFRDHRSLKYNEEQLQKRCDSDLDLCPSRV
jgi:hypothetical protein